VPILHAIVLGLVQGLTEFLPISSSGHLLLVPWLFGWHDFDAAGGASIEKAFDVALHIGTLVAAVAYFRKDIVVYVREGTQMVLHRDRPPTREGRLAWLLLLSSVPAAAVGALFESTIDHRLGKPWIIAVGLIVFGLVLYAADRTMGRRTIEDYTRRDAVIVGAAQVLSLNPGTSRSGITITAGRFLGLNRDSAARVSFLMSLPITAGAVAYKMLKLAKDGVPHGLAGPMAVGIVVSAITGWFAVWGTLRLVRTHSFTPFVVYRVAAGVLVLVVIPAGWR
jgi:undecaprenyl-diphosphatase